jgi:acetyltransferase-like isoleucine patch superfamily enzyme
MLKRYGVLGALRLMFSIIYTRIFFPGARLIRLPFDIRNRQFITIGKGFTCGFGCRIEAFPESKDRSVNILIGQNVQINDYVHIAAVDYVEIGDNVLIASKIFISDHNHGSYTLLDSDHPSTIPANRKASFKPVYIKKNVWIGESVCVLPGVTIGEGSIIGALSVVTKDIPPNSIAVGSPARVVKQFDFETNRWVAV